MELGLPALRTYLDQIGFVQRSTSFIATAHLYHTNPNVLSWASLERAADLESYVTGDRAALGLAACLMLKVGSPTTRSPRSSSRSPGAWSTPDPHLVRRRSRDGRVSAHLGGSDYAAAPDRQPTSLPPGWWPRRSIFRKRFTAARRSTSTRTASRRPTA